MGAGNINSSPPHCVTDTAAVAREGQQRQIMQVMLWAFTVSSGMFPSWQQCQVSQGSRSCPHRESRRGRAGSGQAQPALQLGDAAARAPPLVSMVSRLSRNTTLKHLCLNGSPSLTVSCGTTCAVLHTKERAQDLTDSSAKFLLSMAAHRKQSREQN